MKNYANLRRMLTAAAVVAVAGLMTFSGCTKVDDTLGSDFIPNNQDMKIGIKSFSIADDKTFFETRLYQTDSVISSNTGYGYFGAMKNDTIGSRTAGFMTQYLPYTVSDTSGFGYRPIFDSLLLELNITSFAGDTLQPQEFNVYEIISNEYISKKSSITGEDSKTRDSIFYINFDPTPYIDQNPIFTFKLPNGTTTGPSTTLLNVDVTPHGIDYVDRMLLKTGEYKDNKIVYEQDSLWVKYFKGFYIAPKNKATSKGSLFATKLSSSGIWLYGRNRDKSDPTIIKDTIIAYYQLYSSNASGYGNVSINTINNDYSNSLLSSQKFKETELARPTVSTCYVSGMGGVISEISFTEKFFKEMADIYESAKTENGVKYSSFGVNQALIYIYFEKGRYNWEDIDIPSIIPSLNGSLNRLGMYTNYKTLSPIPDYYYTYEKQYESQDFKLPYSGYINRTQGCYMMDISSYIQTLWNSYKAEVTASEAEGRPFDIEKVKNRTIYLGPEAYGLFSFPYSTVQGMSDVGNLAPIKLDITYTLVK